MRPSVHLSSWKECSLVRGWRDADYHVVIRNPSSLQGGGIKLVVDGRETKGDLVPAFSDGRLHEVEATIAAADARELGGAGQLDRVGPSSP